MVTDPHDAPSEDDESRREADREVRRRGEADAFGALGLVISGVLVWGLAGYGVSRWLDNQVFVMIGLLLGMAAGLYLVWFRYGSQT